MASTLPCWNRTRHPVCVSAPTGWRSLKVRSLSMLVEPLGADLLAGQVLDARDLGAALGLLPEPDHELAGAVVLAGEGDLLPAGAGDRHVARHDVHAAVLQDGQPLGCGDDPQLDLVRVVEDGLRDRVEHVDVEALDPARDRVAGAEQQRVGRDPRDEAAALSDRAHVAARRHLTGAGSVAVGAYDCRQFAATRSVLDGAGEGVGAALVGGAAAVEGREGVSTRRRRRSSTPRPAGSRRARRAPGGCVVGGGSPVLLQSQRDAPPRADRRDHARQHAQRTSQRQPAAPAASSCCAVWSLRPASCSSELVLKMANVALPVPDPVPVASSTAPSQSPESSRVRICWWTEA